MPLLDSYRPVDRYRPGVPHEIWLPSQEASTCHRGCLSCRYQRRSSHYALDPPSGTWLQPSSRPPNRLPLFGGATGLHFELFPGENPLARPELSSGTEESGILEMARGDLLYFTTVARLNSQHSDGTSRTGCVLTCISRSLVPGALRA